MEIFGAGGTQGPQPIYPRLARIQCGCRSNRACGCSARSCRDLPLGQMLDGIGQLPEIRHEKVEEIRRQIAAGSYETPEKLELALDRMLDEMMGW